MGRIQEEASEKLAEKYLFIASEFNDLEAFLSGNPRCELFIWGENGESIFCHELVMNVIYEKCIPYGIVRKINKAFVNAFKKEKHPRRCLNLLKDLEYHIEYEKHNKVPFKLKYKKILKFAKINVDENKIKLKDENFKNYLALSEKIIKKIEETNNIG